MVEEAQALQGADELQACLQVVMSLIEAQEVVDKWGRYPTGTRFLVILGRSNTMEQDKATAAGSIPHF